jgi:hypothetical protein
MRPYDTISTLLIVAAFIAVAGPAQAMYHPGQGRFMQRDPDGYVDGMSSYQYVRSRPPADVDPKGRQATTPASQPGPLVGAGKAVRVQLTCGTLTLTLRVDASLTEHFKNEADIQEASPMRFLGPQVNFVFQPSASAASPPCCCKAWGWQQLYTESINNGPWSELQRDNKQNPGTKWYNKPSDVNSLILYDYPGNPSYKRETVQFTAFLVCQTPGPQFNKKHAIVRWGYDANRAKASVSATIDSATDPWLRDAHAAATIIKGSE